MNLINTILATPLGYLMYLCYAIAKNYGVAIILFTLLSKIILFPLSISVQKNSIRMVGLQPKMDEIKAHYAGDKDRIADEQIKLYDGEKYSPAMGCLPTLIQIPLILGLINVIYNPLQHLLHISKDTISLLTAKTAQLLGVSELGAGAELQIIDAIHNPSYANAFMSLQNTIPDFSSVFERIQEMDVSFLGLNLGMTPSFLNWTSLSWIPIISG
ncbi:MAG: YidC/Oxa1 family membrane protein insertase, partial [Clostridium sp.]|nr:YidC/Oxa1 family membrane protein insertase [Clostridium sp.]